MMNPSIDAPIEEIRDIRKAISERFDNDVRMLANYYRNLEQKNKEEQAKTGIDSIREEKDIFFSSH